MIDGSNIITFALIDFGVDATIDGVNLQVIPCLDGESVLDGDQLDDMIETTRPYVTASSDTITEFDVSSGNDGDTIIIDGTSYTILGIDPDGPGAVRLVLTEIQA